jgi:hypothetical protein
MNRLITGLVVLVGALVAFYVGAKYGEAHASTTATASNATSAGARSGTAASPGAGGRTGAGGAFAPVAAGQIVSLSGGIMTVQDRQTGKDVKVSIASARITKTTQGTAADLTQNTVVTVSGQKGADGVVNAQAIAIGGGGFGGGGGRVRPSPSPST